MNAYSTVYHTVKFTINTIDEDGFVKSIDGENFVQIDRADLLNTKNHIVMVN